MRWRSETCPYCGTSYRDFRAPDQPTFAEAKVEMLRQSRQFCLKGDYGKPASRRAVLGWMHGHKRTHWHHHLELCAQELEAVA